MCQSGDRGQVCQPPGLWEPRGRQTLEALLVAQESDEMQSFAGVMVGLGHGRGTGQSQSMAAVCGEQARCCVCCIWSHFFLATCEVGDSVASLFNP